MISISDPIKDTKQCRYYLAMARSGYYANAHDEPGYWAGRGAELLGLKGSVNSNESLKRSVSRLPCQGDDAER